MQVASGHPRGDVLQPRRLAGSCRKGIPARLLLASALADAHHLVRTVTPANSMPRVSISPLKLSRPSP